MQAEFAHDFCSNKSGYLDGDIMERFCVVTNSSKDVGYKTSKEIRDYLENKGKQCVITRDYANHFEDSLAYTDVSEIPEDTQCAIVLGGDGTFIQAAIDLVHRGIPLLGVNLGTMGFLTEVEQEKVIEALDRLIKDDCVIKERMLIRGIKNITKKDKGKKALDKNEGYALNDIVISKSGECRLISIELYLNGEKIETYIADGIIISTPTGSTGYNLSAGGPVMAPEIKAVIITPICPHSLNKRSMVISGDDEIVVKLARGKDYRIDEAGIMYDGRIESTMVSGESITISQAEEKVQVIRMSERSFFGVLRDKFSQ